MMALDIEDLRSHKREKRFFTVAMSYTAPSSTKLLHYSCATEDISATGLKIVTKCPFDLSQIFDLEISVEESDWVFKFKGEVKWCLHIEQTTTYFVGIKLHEILDNDYQNWLSIIDTLR